ncbi:DnaD domain-containing protein [Pediococcus pentosaceus]
MMNYLQQILAFNDYLLYKQELTSGQIALWYALVAIDNKTGWAEWFTVANRTLESLSGLSRSGISKARNSLKQLELIDFEPNGKKATSYKVCVLYNPKSNQGGNTTETQQKQNGIGVETEQSQNSGTLYKHKHKHKQKQNINKNKTKTKQNAVVTNTSSNNRDSGLNETKSPHQQLFDFYTENFPSTSTFVIQNIEYDADDYGDELVLYAMQKAVLKNVSNYKYVQGILNGWEKDGVKSVEQAKTQETNFKAKTTVNDGSEKRECNKGLSPDDPNYRPGRSEYTNAELKARHERLGW